MSGLIDYAGLFPPAALGMREAVENYAEYLTGPDRSSLGSFIVPLERLDELDDSAASVVSDSSPWRISILVKEGAVDVMSADGTLLWGSAHPQITVASVEMPLSVFRSFGPASAKLSKSHQTYVEVAASDDVASILPSLSAASAAAKLRTGGVTAGAFPSVYHVVRFLRACCNLGLPFKATAGLHHPLRAEYPLTYEPASARARMYGFLNVFLAAAYVWNGADDDVAAKILDESDPSALTFTPDGVSWRGSELSTNRIAAARESFARSFGSCSFREPMDELQSLLSAPAAA